MVQKYENWTEAEQAARKAQLAAWQAYHDLCARSSCPRTPAECAAIYAAHERAEAMTADLPWAFRALGKVFA